MEFDEWAPIYAAICDEFGYDPDEDARVADGLATRVRPSVVDRLSFAGDAVAVVVGAALDRAALERARAADRIVATGDALARLAVADLVVSLAVTDLDSDPPRTCARTRRGGLVAVHAHGDNAPALERWVPRMDRAHVIGTTQAAPTPPLVNVGGFTDGDRAAYLADALGAGSISLVGWALDDPAVGPTKRRKLDWAARLLAALEASRGERYGALDGHRPAR